MLFGTVVYMKKNDLFITQAMLASYLSVEHKNYLELIEPFVLKSLPVVINEKIDISKIQIQVNEEYNLDILYNVVEKILQRLAKQKHGSYVRKEYGNYFVNRLYDDTKFNSEKTKIKNSLERVVLQLKNFLVNEKKQTNVTEEIAKEYLSIFLDTYNYSIYANVESANTITVSDSQSKTNYYVAQFILCEYQKKSTIYDCILEIIKGTLVAKSIYYFMFEENNEYCRKINGTKFYLDTRLLIGVLGLNSQQEHSAMSELVNIINKNGGKLVTFKHYVDELIGILYKYARDVNSRLNLSLQKLTTQNATALEAEMYAKTIETRLEELGISIEEVPDYSELIDTQAWHIDYTALRSALDASINYKLNHNSDPLKNDCDTIEAIAFFRRNCTQCSVDNCNAIFVTKNKDIVNVINRLYYKERFSKGEINFAISDVDLTAMLWLSTFGCKSDLPQLKLLEDVYAACAPSNSVMKAFLNKIKYLEESEKITQEMAILLRTDYSMMDDLTELTDNNSSRVTDETIYEMQARISNREKKIAMQNAREKLSSEFAKLEDQQELNKQEQTAVEEKRNDLIQLQKKVLKEKQDVRVIANRIEKQRIKNEDISNQNAQTIKKIEKLRNSVIRKAKDKAKKIASIVQAIMNIACVLFLIICVVIFSYATYKVSDFTTNSLVVSYIIVGIVSIVGFISSAVSFKKFFSKFIERKCENIYDYIYDKEINKNKELFED